MAIGIFVGVTLVMVGLLLLAHLSYTNYGSDGDKISTANDPENPSNGSRHPAKINDCPLPLCFFRVAAVANHETWIVAFLLGGSAVLALSLAVGY